MQHKNESGQPRTATPPAEQTNFDHPGTPGSRGTVPGAGVVSPGADVSRDEVTGHRARNAPGAGPDDAPLAAPGAQRPEALNPPDDTDNPPAVSDELPGIADPNFPTDKDRPENRDM